MALAGSDIKLDTKLRSPTQTSRSHEVVTLLSSDEEGKENPKPVKQNDSLNTQKSIPKDVSNEMGATRIVETLINQDEVL